MIEKKNTKVNQEKTKTSNFFVGLSFIGGVTLAAFTYQSEVDSGINIPNVNYSSNISYEEENVDKPIINEPPKLQETQPQQEVNLNNDIVVVESVAMATVAAPVAAPAAAPAPAKKRRTTKKDIAAM